MEPTRGEKSGSDDEREGGEDGYPTDARNGSGVNVAFKDRSIEASPGAGEITDEPGEEDGEEESE